MGEEEKNMREFIVFWTVVWICAVGTQVVRADIITSASDPALAGATVIEFESAPKGTHASLTIGEVTFTGVDRSLRIDDSYSGWYSTTGSYLDNWAYFDPGFSSMRIDFAADVSAFGFNWGGADSAWSLTAYNAFGDSLGVYNLPAAVDPDPPYGGAFVGLGGFGSCIDHAVLSWPDPDPLDPSDYDWIFIDNFMYQQVVPVPGAVLLGVLGLSAAGARLRRMRA